MQTRGESLGGESKKRGVYKLQASLRTVLGEKKEEAPFLEKILARNFSQAGGSEAKRPG